MLTALKNFVLLTKENFSPSNITKRYCYSLQINICMRIVFLIYTNPLTSPFSKTAAIAAFEIQGLKFKRYLVLNTLCHFLLKKREKRDYAESWSRDQPTQKPNNPEILANQKWRNILNEKQKELFRSLRVKNRLQVHPKKC